ncbi:uncharacterized protein EV420DRAFT_1623805 [Desarmillaria tabescens]|uniref:Glucose-methanol-choline oxidoreductase N-terminal domain-containing protein n=1 Tax=Armillaria tabescens TaxID=1929756 RepID=A0AA39J318_ARMTA|nr:uncharacterized protein EV420DRAFT_1623805 [Desarmillaria tabescens]KAK0434381.1 hypothetical protein EV420DRAFT_1623805 [Desarmillaria tabescens]
MAAISLHGYLCHGTNLRREAHYDFDWVLMHTEFVVVGGGPGGSMVARQMSEDLTVNVLLLEVGGENDPAVDSALAVPLFYTTLTPKYGLRSELDDHSTRSSSMAEIIWAIGLGDSSAVNDIDKWAELFGRSRLGEKFNIIPRNGHNTTGQYLPAFHGTDGVIGVNLVDGGQRSSAKAHLLRAENEGRENIDVLLHARVSRVVPTVDGMLDLRSVEVLDPADGMHAYGHSKISLPKNEIILSTGSVMTPTILHSGIGDPELLEPLSITTISSLPSVGKNLTTTFIVNSTGHIRHDTSENHAAWLRLPDNSTMFDNYSDPSSGPLTRTLRNGLSSVRAIDILIVLEPIKAARRFFSGPAWEGYILGLRSFIRENVVSFFHPVSTASMSPVKGASGLKVVDASVIPRLPAVHTSAPVYAVAERAADIIKAAIWVAG